MIQGTAYKSKQRAIKTGFPLQTPGHHTLSIGDGGAAGLAKGSAVPRWPGWTGLPSCDHVSHEA